MSNPLNIPTVSRSEFRRALNIRCHKEFGLGLLDLPDIICIDDNWYEGMDEREATIMVDGCIEELKEELGVEDDISSINTPVYDINE